MKKSAEQAFKRITELKEIIQKHDYSYYVLDKPEITDFEYDALYSELNDLEQKHPEYITQDSPTQRVGGVALSKFPKIQHRIPMLSLQNSYSPEDITAFNERVLKFLKDSRTPSQIEYFCEPKFDGLAIELVYEKGVLTHALTRGDGTTGEDVLQNIKTIKSIPLRLRTDSPPELIEIRGEVLLFKNDFVKLNEQQQEDGEEPFANPRNAAAGTIRQLDPKIASSRNLRFYAYALGAVEGIEFEKQGDLSPHFKKWGIPTVGISNKLQSVDFKRGLSFVGNNAEDAVEYYKKIETIRHDLPFEIDGIVVKVNSFQLQNELGFIARSPRWATAAKFTPNRAETVIKEIIVQVGRTGALTPVAVMEPVDVGGVTITHATLHNQDEIDRKDIREGDAVLVHRAGDVIPEIIEVLKEKRKATSKSYSIPSKCPVCKSMATKTEGEAVTRCANPACEAKLREGLKHFVSKRAMNVELLGDKMIDLLVDQKLVHRFSDIYKIKLEDLRKLERQGEKSSQNLIDSIEASKNSSLGRFIFALGIRFVGEQTAKLLADHFGNIEKFLAAKEEDLLAVDGVGEKVAESILNATAQKSFVLEINKLLDSGIKFSTKNKTGKLTGLTFVITGTLPIPRDEVKDQIESNGGTVSSSVSKKTNYLIAGEEAGSKLENAKKLGVSVLDYNEFLKLIKDGRS